MPPKYFVLDQNRFSLHGNQSFSCLAKDRNWEEDEGEEMKSCLKLDGVLLVQSDFEAYIKQV
jgi:hypothetical protein